MMGTPLYNTLIERLRIGRGGAGVTGPLTLHPRIADHGPACSRTAGNLPRPERHSRGMSFSRGGRFQTGAPIRGGNRGRRTLDHRLRRVTRLLLDQSLAPGAAAMLRGKGLDDFHVLDVDLYRAEDAEILEFARTEARTCITLDHDFHAHLALSRKDNPSVVLLRVEGLNAAEQAALIRTVWRTV